MNDDPKCIMINNKNWHVVYTRSRAEKKVLAEMEYLGIEAYLPIQKQLRQWSDRKKWVDVPLLPGYLFVCITQKQYDKALQADGVVAYVRFEGKAAVIPEEQILTIKQLLEQTEIKVETLTQNFKSGDKVEVIAGPLLGVNGTLIHLKGRNRVAVQIEQLQISLTVEIPIENIQKTSYQNEKSLP